MTINGWRRLTVSSATSSKPWRRPRIPASYSGDLGTIWRGEKGANERRERGEDRAGVVKARGALMAA